MGERKGISKYYPPDFDPSKLTRVKKPKDREISSRFMLPMSVRCETCGEFMGAGLKFNAEKSLANETYLGMKIYRFSMKCKACPAAFVIKTDPKHQDYVCEAGAKRNFQPWRAEKEADENSRAVREEQDQDAMQALENKTIDAQKEMEELDELDEIKARNAASSRVSTDELLRRHRRAGEGNVVIDEEQLAEEARVAFAFKRRSSRSAGEFAEKSLQVIGHPSGEDICSDVFKNEQNVLAKSKETVVVSQRSMSSHSSKRRLPGVIMGENVIVTKRKKPVSSARNGGTSNFLVSEADTERKQAIEKAGEQVQQQIAKGLVAYGSGSGDNQSSSSSETR